jgi:hypothetical protein
MEMVGSYNFRKDISVGENGERILIEFYKQYGGKFIKKSSDSEMPYWDLMFEFPDNKIVKTEVKTDVWVIPGKTLSSGYVVMGKDRGNLFIEKECRGKGSGISITTADWWVNIFYHLNEIWFIQVDKLKKLIEENDFKVTEQSGDEGSNTSGYLIPRDDFRKNFIIKNFK